MVLCGPILAISLPLSAMASDDARLALSAGSFLGRGVLFFFVEPLMTNSMLHTRHRPGARDPLPLTSAVSLAGQHGEQAAGQTPSRPGAAESPRITGGERNRGGPQQV